MDAFTTTPETLTSPFVTSWVGQARPGDVTDPQWDRRTGAWAQWVMQRLTTVSGYADRQYVAFTLNGEFYTKNPSMATIKPHIEIPRHVLAAGNGSFPAVLAAAGNTMLFSAWLPMEVTAIKRALFASPVADGNTLLEPLVASRTGLVDQVLTLTAALGNCWPQLEMQLVNDPGLISEQLCAGFDTSEVCRVVPGLAGAGARVVFDGKLADKAGPRAARRVGVWRIVGDDDVAPVALPAVTPRLTRSSLFTDALFAPAHDGVASLLVRCLMLARLTNVALAPVAADVDPVTVTGLRIVPARPGERMPEASLKAAAAFVQTYPDAHHAWEVMSSWVQRRPSEAALVLTVTGDGFMSAHKRVMRAVRRAEEPTREEVNVLLPLAWEAGSRVVRVTFSRPDITIK